VDSILLAAAPRLKIVATPVVGLDHVICDDMRAAQRQRGHPIHVFSAPGSTAAGVADWVVSAIFHTLPAVVDLRQLKVGIWGFGNCGRALAARLTRLGIRYVAYDPPKEAQTAGAFHSADRDELWQCDVVSLHVPLTDSPDNRWSTRGMVDRGVFTALAAGDVRLLCNTSRGGVIDDAGLTDFLSSGHGPEVAVDVYQNEPTPDPAIVSRTRIATAHVAGSVMEGRRKAVAKVREEVRRILGVPSTTFPAEPVGGFACQTPFCIPARSGGIAEGIMGAVPLDEWTRLLRETYLDAIPAQRPAAFEDARRQGLRREIGWGRLRLAD